MNELELLQEEFEAPQEEIVEVKIKCSRCKESKDKIVYYSVSDCYLCEDCRSILNF